MAKQQLFQALKLNPDSTLQSLIYLNLGRVYEKENMTDSAVCFAKLSTSFLTKQNDIHALAANYKILSRLEKKNNNFHKAFDYIQQYLKYYTQIKEEHTLDIQKMETQHKLETLQRKEHSMRRLYITVILCLCLAIIFTVYFCIKSIRKKKAELAKMQTEMNVIKKHVDVKSIEIKDIMANIQPKLTERTILTDLYRQILSGLYKNIEKLLSDFKKNVITLESVPEHLQSISYKNSSWNVIYETGKLTFDEIRKLYPELTEPEFKILCLEYLGYTNTMIASIVNLGKNTVQQNKTNIKKKLNITEDSITSFIAKKLGTYIKDYVNLN
jgi:ATP/maltotriose-dependent transcriptional regulator MalT